MLHVCLCECYPMWKLACDIRPAYNNNKFRRRATGRAREMYIEAGYCYTNVILSPLTGALQFQENALLLSLLSLLLLSWAIDIKLVELVC